MVPHQDKNGRSVTCFIQTGQQTCHDASGEQIPCAGSGQDAEFSKGIAWPSPRFHLTGATVSDELTGLTWLQNANAAEFPLDWHEAARFIEELNKSGGSGYADWRLPTRRELRSLISHQTVNPVLPQDHPFGNLVSGWYWTSDSAAVDPAYAWYVHLGGGRSFHGAKDRYYLVWPVRGHGNAAVSRRQPMPRFIVDDNGVTVLDRMSNLRWRRDANFTGEGVLWEEALRIARAAAAGPAADDARSWRLPNINELESLVDLSRHSPALPTGHPFTGSREVYWSSTTSMFEPDWAWALYLHKGAIGVGRKDFARFSVWLVSG